MKILELVAGYPDLNGGKASSFVHTRNIYYLKKGIQPVVLNFRATEDYEIDGVPVIRLMTYQEKYQSEKFAILASHASNLREHYRFLKKNEKNFPHIVFFFHGHEVLRINECYPKPYSYMKGKSLQRLLIQDIYDTMKFYLWKKEFQYLSQKAAFVFVSEWMKDRFFYYLKMRPENICNHDHVIYNCIGNVFEDEKYCPKNIQYDFVTIRANLDGSKYGIDIVNQLAKNNPQFSFLVVGKGNFFQKELKANNLIWMNETLDHGSIVKLLNQCRCVLMPTRLDAQGLMVCEMATFGIPTITSEIPVCHEICDAFDNVELIDNEKVTMDLAPVLEKLIAGLPYQKNPRYFAENTMQKEVDLFMQLAKEH